MPHLSRRGMEMPESPIRKLVPFAEGAVAAGKKVYFMNIGQPDIASPDVALKAVRENKLRILEYSHSAGFLTYRKGLAKYYRSLGIKIDPEQIIITTGGSEALMFGFMSCLNEGDEVIIPEPFYANYNGFAVASGVKIVPVTSSIDNGFALPPIEEIEKLITGRTKAILICNPGNPTGYLYSKDELLRLRDIVEKFDLFLFADEVYREFCYDGHEHFSVMQLDGLDRNVVLIDSISKRYSMCGARIGAIISRNKYVMQAAMKFAQARLSPPTLAQIAGEAALAAPLTYFDEVKKEYAGRRNVLVGLLNKIPGVKCPMPKGAFYAVAELPVEDADVFAQWLLEDFEYNNQTVMIAPASGFYATPGKGKKEVRIAYVLEEESIIKAVKCLEEALKIYPARTGA
ncbi:MAG: pyridoxal phosphate-dependent aminotransferase [Vicingaceae bacterium]